MDKTNLITITLSIPESTIKQLEDSKSVLSEKYKTTDRLPEPHVTLYQCKVPEELLETALIKIENIVKKYRPLVLTSEGLNVKNEYIGISYIKSNDIENVHSEIVYALNKMRGKLLRNTYIEKYSNYSPSEQNNIDTYGYPYVFSDFKPHIALIKLNNKNDAKLIDDNLIPKLPIESCVIDIIILNDKNKTKRSFSLENHS